jgi:hypothetical protein
MWVIKDIAEKRYTICKSCDKFNKLKFCEECNCFMPAKVRIALARCPLKKWKPEYKNVTPEENYSINE